MCFINYFSLGVEIFYQIYYNLRQTIFGDKGVEFTLII